MGDDIMDFLSRRSIRKYKDIPVEKEKLDELLKVAIVAPTGHNARACEFIVFENSEDVKKLKSSHIYSSFILYFSTSSGGRYLR